MGIDSCIYILAEEEFSYIDYDTKYLNPKRHGFGGLVNYEIEPYQRYYSEDYPRGHWPTLAKCLLNLLADPCVNTVYYIGDNQELDFNKIKPFTQKDLFRLSAFYIKDNKQNAT